MSVSIRISDEIYEEINSVKPSEMSFGKTADALLKIAIKCLDDEDGNDESGDDFPEKIKRISEKQSYEKEDVFCENDDLKNENANEENGTSGYEKIEEMFLNIENEITEINPGDSTCLNIIFHPDDIGKFQREILLYGNFDSSPKLLTITGECF